jgi:hypothetical protein
MPAASKIFVYIFRQFFVKSSKSLLPVQNGVSPSIARTDFANPSSMGQETAVPVFAQPTKGRALFHSSYPSTIPQEKKVSRTFSSALSKQSLFRAQAGPSRWLNGLLWRH